MRNSFGHDFAHALIARDIEDEYRQIDGLYGQRAKSWQFVRQTLSMLPTSTDPAHDMRRYDIVTIRLANGEERDVYFDITSFYGTWPDHAAGRILPGTEMNVREITGAGQVARPTVSWWPVVAFVGLAGLAAYGLGKMAEYRPSRARRNPCGCTA